MTTLFVAGCGLLGTSVARAYRRSQKEALIVGIEPDVVARKAAMDLGVYSDVVASVGSAQTLACDENSVHGSIGVAATPPALLAESLLALAPFCELVVDVGSIKAPVIKELQQAAASDAGIPSNIVPCHPMAGSEDSGPGAGNVDLFSDRWVFVVPTESSAADKVHSAHDFWRGLGAHTQEIAADAHDQAVAYTSHLPHLLSSAYMELQTPQPAAAGTGFMGFTRLAKANPEMWSQVLIANRQAWQPLLRRYIELLEQTEKIVESSDAQALRRWLEHRREERLAAEPSRPVEPVEPAEIER